MMEKVWKHPRIARGRCKSHISLTHTRNVFLIT
jgi:hypothetical protein